MPGSPLTAILATILRGGLCGLALTILPIAAAKAGNPTYTPPSIEVPDAGRAGSPAVHPAPASAYTAAVASLYGKSLSVPAMLAACSEASPQTRQVNEAAYQAWRKQHSATLDLIDRHADEVILENAHGDLASARQLKQRYWDQVLGAAHLEYGNNSAVPQAIFAVFPRQLNLPTFDPEHCQATELSRLLSHPLPK